MTSERRKAYKKLAIVSAIAENVISRQIAKAKDARSGSPIPVHEMQAMLSERPIKAMINTPAHLFGNNLKIDPRRLRRHNRKTLRGRTILIKGIDGQKIYEGESIKKILKSFEV